MNKQEVINKFWATKFCRDVLKYTIRDWEIYLKRKLTSKEKDNLKRYEEENAWIIHREIALKQISIREGNMIRDKIFEKYMRPFYDKMKEVK